VVGRDRRRSSRLGADPGFRDRHRKQLLGPSYSASARIAALSGTPTRETVGSTAKPTQAQIDEARKHFAYVMFASFCALLLGAGAAYAAGMATTGAAIKQAAKPVT
jgi:hypothetical protein